MTRKLVASCLTLLLALANPWPASAEDPDLAAGVRQAQQGEFEAAVATLGGVVRRLSTQRERSKELSRAYTYLAVAHLGLGHDQDARSRFIEALKADPALTLSAREFPPKILKFFEDVRKESGVAAAPTPAPEKPAEKPPAAAAGPSIDHQAVQCLVAERYPRLDARLAPSDQVSRARVYFKAEGPIWYYVDMKAEAGAYVGVLPKPKKSTKTIQYYVEGVDKAFAGSRTGEYAPDVVSDEKGCANKLVASFIPKANVVVGAPVGAPPLPPGFDAAGVTSASGQSVSSTSQPAEPSGAAAKAGGGSGKTIALVAGGAAVVGGVALAAGGGGSSKPTPPPCNPSPDFDFTVDLAFTGSVNCATSNARAQTYRITNRSCSAVNVQSLRVDKTSSGGCNVNPVENLSLNGATSVPGATGGSATTAVIRTAPAAGTAHLLCCSQYPCTKGTCNINETYTVTTSAGTKTLTNSVSVVDNTGRDCVPCAGAVGPRSVGSDPASLQLCTDGGY